MFEKAKADRDAVLSAEQEYTLASSIDKLAKRADCMLNAQIESKMCPDFDAARERKMCQGCHYFALYIGGLQIKKDGDKFTFTKGHRFWCKKFNREATPLNTEPCFTKYFGHGVKR